MTNRLKKIISGDMLANMEMLAITNVGMRDILEQAKVIYALNGSPDFFARDDDENDDEPCVNKYEEYNDDDDF